MRPRFRTPRVILLALQYFLWSIGVYGFVIWLPSILKIRDMGMVELGWLSAVPYLAAVIAEIVTSTYSDLVQKRLSGDLAVPGAGGRGFLRSPILLGGAHFWASFVLLIIAGAMMYAPYGPFFAHIAETLAAQCRGWRHRADQQHGRAGLFCGRLWRGHAERHDRFARRVLPDDGGGPVSSPPPSPTCCDEPNAATA